MKDLKEAKEIPVLTPGAGERAMLIKSTRDSGICVGVWEGLREAKPKTKTDPVLPSTPGKKLLVCLASCTAPLFVCDGIYNLVCGL